jgi:hypothetical protein
MATQGMSYQELETRRKLLLEELATTTQARNEQIASQESIDIHHPELSRGWKRYQFQEYPKTMYHPIELDPVRLDHIRGVQQRNLDNPNLAPLPVPHPKPLTRIVQDKADEERAAKEGFLRLPPQLAQPAKPLLEIDERLLAVEVKSPRSSRKE